MRSAALLLLAAVLALAVVAALRGTAVVAQTPSAFVSVPVSVPVAVPAAAAAPSSRYPAIPSPRQLVSLPPGPVSPAARRYARTSELTLLSAAGLAPRRPPAGAPGVHSQQGEDAAFLEMFPVLCAREGTFVELGGLDGRTDSNSLLLEERFGWRGLMVEPNPANFAKLRKNRPLARAVRAVVCAPVGAEVEFAFVKPATGTVVHGLPGGVRAAQVSGRAKMRCEGMGELLAAAGLRHVTLFSLDVEGAEAQVLETMDWGVRVDVWIVERGPAEQMVAVHNLLTDHGYQYVRDLRGNRWYCGEGCGGEFHEGG